LPIIRGSISGLKSASLGTQLAILIIRREYGEHHVLRTREIFIAGKILVELAYSENPPKLSMKQELKDMFGAMDEDEKLL